MYLKLTYNICSERLKQLAGSSFKGIEEKVKKFKFDQNTEYTQCSYDALQQLVKYISLKEVTSSKPSSPPRSPSKERKEDEEEGGGGGEENDRTSSEGLKKDEKTKELMEEGEEKVGEKDDEVKNTSQRTKNLKRAL